MRGSAKFEERKRDEREDELRAGDSLLDRSRHPRSGCCRRVLRRPLRLERREPTKTPSRPAVTGCAMLKDKAIGGVMKLMQEGQPPAWSSYICVEDADATVAKAARSRRRRGGRADGRARLRPHGGPRRSDRRRLRHLAAGQKHRRRAWSTSRARSPGTSSTPAIVAAAKAFYGAVFGWAFEDDRHGGRWAPTPRIKLGERERRRHRSTSPAGCPTRSPPHWLVYFAVDDHRRDVSRRRSELGGSVAFGPIDIPAGRLAILTDPWGAAFAVIALSPRSAGERLELSRGRRPPPRGRRPRPRPPSRRACRGWRS